MSILLKKIFLFFSILFLLFLNKNFILAQSATSLAKDFFYSDLDNEINFESPKENIFNARNFKQIDLFYYKIDNNDLKFLLLNRNNYNQVKNYFLKKDVTYFKSIKPQENTFNYIPESKNGLYFCYQKVKLLNNNEADFFQIYNFNILKPLAFDTEEGILFYFPQAEKIEFINVYSESIEFLIQTIINKDNYCVIKNNGYKNIFIELIGSNYFLFEVKLNGIVKSEKRIVAFCDRSDIEKLKIFGIIFNFNKNREILSYKVFNDKLIINSNKIVNIDKEGNFYFEINKNFLPKEELILSFYSNEILIKNYKLEIFIKGDIKNQVLNYLKLNENLIFDDNNPLFFIDKNIFSKIEIIKYFWKGKGSLESGNGYIKEFTYNYFSISLPRIDDEYTIEIELILKDGISYKEEVKVKKIILNENIKEKKFLVNIDDFDKNFIIFYNPFKSASCVLVSYDNNIESVNRIIEVNYGFNKIPLKNINKCNLKYAIILYDNVGKNIIYKIKENFLKESCFNKIDARYYDYQNTVKIEIDSELREKVSYFYFQKFNYNFDYEEFLFNLFYRYNDITSPDNSLEELNRGEVKSSKEKEFYVTTNSGNDYTIGFFYLKEKVYYSYKKIKRDFPLRVSIYGPSKFKDKDFPFFKLILKNKTEKEKEVSIRAFVDNAKVKLEEERFKIIGYENKEVKFYFEEHKNKGINLVFLITCENKIFEVIKEFEVVDSNIKKIVEIKGNLIEDRNFSSYLMIPEEVKEEYTIELIFSINPIVILYSAFIQQDFISYFEKDFLTFLDLFIEEYITSDFNHLKSKLILDEILEKYLVKDKGIKRFIFDKEINLESTLLFLLALSVLEEYRINIKQKNIINNLLTNYYTYLTSSDFAVFVFSELGYLFEDIKKDFLFLLSKNIKKLFYYNYFIKHKIAFDLNIKEHNSTNYFKFSESLFELLKVYYNFDNVDYKKINIYHNFFDNLLAKIVLLKKLKGLKKGNKRLEFDFKSKELEDIRAIIQENEVVYKKYNFFMETKKEGKILNFSITKNGVESLYYIIRLKYKGESDFFIENNRLKIFTEWQDKSSVLNKNNIILKRGEKYGLKINILLEEGAKFLFIKHYFSYLFSIKVIETDDIKIKFDEDFLLVYNLKKGITSIVLNLIPLFEGEYFISGMRCFDLVNGIFSEEEKIKVRIN